MTGPELDIEFEVIGEEKIPKDVEYLITAMPENGFAGVLALRRLIEDLNMDMYGYASSDVTNTLFRFEDGQPRPSIPLHGKDGIFTLSFEIPVSQPMTPPVGRLIIRLARQTNAENLIMLSSAPSSTRRDKSYEEIRGLGAFLGNHYAKLVEDLDLETISNATLSGPFAWVLNSRMMENNGALVLLSETHPSPMIDPSSAAKLLDMLSKILGKRDQINIQGLLEQSQEIKSQLKKLQKTAQKAQEGQTTRLADFYT